MSHCMFVDGPRICISDRCINRARVSGGRHSIAATKASQTEQGGRIKDKAVGENVYLYGLNFLTENSKSYHTPTLGTTRRTINAFARVWQI